MAHLQSVSLTLRRHHRQPGPATLLAEAFAERQVLDRDRSLDGVAVCAVVVIQVEACCPCWGFSAVVMAS